MPAQILIIEDNETNLDLMVYLLKAYGYTPIVARDGREGLQAATAKAPDLIICDLHIPKMDGYEVGRQVKGHPNLSKVPLIAVTALAMVGDRDKVLASGFDGYLPKPIVPETFVRQVEAFLRPEQRSNQLPIISAAAGEPAKHPAKRATILVVDDSPVNLNLIRSTLEPFGYQVILAPGPKEAMELARQTRLDLILSDLHMPDQSGFEFLQRIKADPQLRSIPFLLFSASSSAHAELDRASALGAERFLCRPIEPQALLAEVEACLGSRKGSEHG